jgi:hypothetical protein
MFLKFEEGVRGEIEESNIGINTMEKQVGL